MAASVRIGFRPADAAARHCRDYGCGCADGAYDAIRFDLVCGPCSPDVLDGLGLCLRQDERYGPQRLGSGVPCVCICGWGPSGDGCGGGYCDDNGLCGVPRCTGSGCACAIDTHLPCVLALVSARIFND